jgi:hypothetical protein
MIKDYEKANVMERVKNYDRKAFYEELKLKELEIKHKL